MASSLEHLGTDYLDITCCMAIFPSRMGELDAEGWQAMTKERDAGAHGCWREHVSLRHLEQLVAVHGEAQPSCRIAVYARLGWDREVRVFCGGHSIVYQGFSLLTANQDVLRHPPVIDLAQSWRNNSASHLQFWRARGMLLSPDVRSRAHARGLGSIDLALSPDAVKAIRGLQLSAVRLARSRTIKVWRGSAT